MKLQHAILFLCLALFTALPAFGDRYLTEIRMGYYRPFSDELRDIYSDGWANYQVDISYSPGSDYNPCWRNNFFLWGTFNYLYDKGETRSRVDDDETDLQMYNFSLGVKYIHPIPCGLRLYAGTGFRYFFLRIDNYDDTVDKRERADGLGSVYTLGVLAQPWRCFVVDLFTDLSIKNFTESNFRKNNNEFARGVDMSGITFGLGVGIVF